MVEIRRQRSYAEVCAAFRWRLPEQYNIAWDTCGKWARRDPDRVALIEVAADGDRRVWSFAALAAASARLANTLVAANGVGRGDRCAVLLPQSAGTVLAHLALYRIGAVAVPMFSRFGTDALAWRVGNSGARIAITDPEHAPGLAGVDALERLLVLGAAGRDLPDGMCCLDRAMARASDRFGYAATDAEEPALLCYTSGTTGAPKGVLHAHRVLLGHLPGIQLPHEFFPQPGDRMWTPADWAWLGGLTNVMLPALRYGVPLVAWRSGRFDPEAVLAMMAREGVRNSFLPPTALRMIRQAVPRGPVGPKLRTVASGGEALGAETLDWGRGAFGLVINEFYGQTECNLVVGNCASLFPPVPGSAGRALPGHRVAAIGPDGRPVAPGGHGELAIRRPDPSLFLGYWQLPAVTREKFAGDWFRTGDLGSVDEAGHVRFLARNDDVITSSGYRIGPGEIEDCLTGHPAIALAGVVGVADALRTEVVTAFVVRSDAGGRTGDSGPDDAAALSAALQARVRDRVGAHAVPRAIHFLDTLPLTATGKVMRRKLRQLADGSGRRRAAARRP